MKKLFYVLSLISCFLSIACSNNSQDAKPFKDVESTVIYKDSVEIRAITPINDSTVWFVGNNGKVGFIEGTLPKLANITYEEIPLSFRSIAKTKEAVFMLSIANPAVLYKVGFDGNKATYIEDVYIEKGEKVFYNAMKFWNDNEGIAMGDATNGCLSIIITRDGGNTWKKLDCTQLPALNEGEVAFAASNSNIAVYKNDTWIVTGGSTSRVFYSPDKGESWQVYNTPIVSGGEMTGIYAIDFYNSKQGVIIGGDWNHKAANAGNKATTTDGGKTWQLVNENRNPGYKSSIRFVPNTKGQGFVAVSTSGVSYSSDFGATWEELSKEGFYTIEFVNDSVAFASGKNKIAKLVFKR